MMNEARIISAKSLDDFLRVEFKDLATGILYYANIPIEPDEEINQFKSKNQVIEEQGLELPRQNIELGMNVIDSITGFTGVVVSKHYYVDGSVRVTVQPRVNKNFRKLPEAQTFDESVLSTYLGEI